MTEVISKGDFAKRRGVSAAAVSQWISSNRLTGDALVGEGRFAKINVAEAERQLGVTLDLGQQMARGGRPTASAAAPLSPEDDHQARYQKARADSAEIEADRARSRQMAERGIYTLTEASRTAWSKVLSDLLHAVDQWLSDTAERLSAHIASGNGTDAKALTVFLRQEWRAFRTKRSTLAASASDALPELVPETTPEA